ILVKGEELKTKKIGLYYDEIPLIACESKNEKIFALDSTILIKKSKPALYEDFSHFKPNDALCVVTIDRFNFDKWRTNLEP
ncbi:hypothetical protein PFISCL1PPCAC_4532, partial [Pristionchus fissidentatus]